MTLPAPTRRRLLAALAAGAAGVAAPRLPAQPAASALPLRAIPSTGRAIPVIGLGSWITFNVGRDPQLRAECTRVIGAFVDGGGTVIDSSPMYGSSQDVIGQALRALHAADRVFAADKVWTSDGAQGAAQAEALRRLWGVPRFALLQVHNLLNWQAHLPLLLRWKAEGRIGHVGITTSEGRRHTEFEQLMRTQPLDFVRQTAARQPLCADIDGNRAARRGARRSPRPQAAGAAVPLHHAAGAFRREGASQRCRAGGARAEDAVARWHHAPGDEPAGVHAAAGRAGAAASVAPHQVWCPRHFATRNKRTPAARTWGAGPQREAAGAGGAAGAACATPTPYHAKADLWGLCPGCYPKARAPVPPFHPHCWCRLRSRPDLDADDARVQPGAAQAFLRGLPQAEAARVLGSKERLYRALNGADPVDIFDQGAAARYRTRRAGEPLAGENDLMPKTPADRMIDGLTTRAQRADRFADLWVDAPSYERHLARRLGALHVRDEAEYVRMTRRTLATADRVVVVTPVDPQMRLTGKVAMIGGDWTVLLSQEGRIVTSYPFDARKVQFEDRHRQLGDRIDEYSLSEAQRRLLARVFGAA